MEEQKKPIQRETPEQTPAQLDGSGEALQPDQKPGLDPKGAEKYNVHPKSVVWDDPKLQKAWEALHAGSEEEA
jgi:hypothetical protein